MNNSWSIRKFLLIQPRAEVIRLSSGDDSVPTEMRPTRSKSWSKLAESIHAIRPELIELLDKDGNVIRALRPNEELTRSDAAAVPAALTTDPETARLTHFANLLHRAYEHSTEIAFAKLIELVERIDARSDAIESRLERTESAHRRLLQDQIDDAWERAAEAATGDDSEAKQAILSSLMQGAMAGSNGARAPTNGKGHS